LTDEEETLEGEVAPPEVPIYAEEPSPLDSTPSGEHTWTESLDGIEVGDTWKMSLFKIVIPFAIPSAIFIILFLALSYTTFLQLGGLALSYLFPPFGKESIIPFGIAAGFTILQMTALVFMVDVVCAMFISWNLPLAKQIPLIGRLIIWIEKKGRETLSKNPALETLSWIGLVLWVMVPFQGSGGITASVIGRAIGMRASRVISAVGIGAIIAGLIIGTVAQKGWEIIRDNWVTGVIMIVGIAVVAVVLFFLYRRYTTKKNQEALERKA
jgi:uncharacterized membrane protein